MNTGREIVIEFAVNLAKRCILQEPILGTENDFFNCIEFFKNTVIKQKGTENMVLFLKELETSKNVNIIKNISGDLVELREHLSIMFSEWIRNYHHPSSNEMTQLIYVDGVIL